MLECYDSVSRRLRLALVFPYCLYRPDRARQRPDAARTSWSGPLSSSRQRRGTARPEAHRRSRRHGQVKCDATASAQAASTSGSPSVSIAASMSTSVDRHHQRR